MQIIYDGRKVQVWEFVSQGLNIGKWSTGKHCDGVAVVKNVKTIMCIEGGTLRTVLDEIKNVIGIRYIRWSLHSVLHRSKQFLKLRPQSSAICTFSFRSSF